MWLFICLRASSIPQLSCLPIKGIQQSCLGAMSKFAPSLCANGKNHIALNCHVKTLPPWHFPCSVFVCVPCKIRTFCVKCCWLLVKTLKLQRSTEAKPLLYRIPFSFSWSSEELRQHRGLIKNHYQFGIFLGENVVWRKGQKGLSN